MQSQLANLSMTGQSGVMGQPHPGFVGPSPGMMGGMSMPGGMPTASMAGTAMSSTISTGGFAAAASSGSAGAGGTTTLATKLWQ